MHPPSRRARELRFRMSPALLPGSPGWTRTNNPPVNSRMLCQLSYRGSLLSDRHHSNREGWSLNQFGPRLLQGLAGERAHAGVVGVEALVVLHEPANLAPGGRPASDHVEPLAPAYDGASLEDH